MSERLGELLVSQGLISKRQLQDALDNKTRNRIRLSSSLIQLGHVNEKVLTTFLAKQYGIQAVSLDEVSLPPDLIKMVPYSLCEKHLLVPLSIDKNRVAIAIADPTNVTAVDDVRFLLNMEVDVYLSTESGIKRLMERAYANRSAQIEMAESLAEEEEEEGHTASAMVEVAKLQAQSHQVESDQSGDKPVIRLINKLFVEAIRRKCSDIHIEPFETFSRVRFRVDGSLHEVMKLPPQMKASTPARIKVMAQLDISEKRLPQDGRIHIKTKHKKIDVRVSTLPTMFGEKVVLRLLDQGEQTPDLLAIGFETDQYQIFKKAASQPYGMILVTGPTGSGKSTTLYAALNELNQPDVNISTVEDPVEYNMTGINQVQMKENIGLTFSASLRSLLRQDPDIIMVGEVRDQETAEIAIKAALTGHMVFSTLHTNDAPSTITRLVHMGVEPFLITAALTLVQAQRLVRLICRHCAVPDKQVTKERLLEAEMPQHWVDSVKPMRGKGCDQCGSTGYQGRRGIFEVLYLTEKLRDLIIKGGNADQLKKAALEEGLVTLRQAALLKLYRGETTLEEVLNNSRPDGEVIKS